MRMRRRRRKISLPTYKEYLCENGLLSLNIGGLDPVFGGDCVSEFDIGCVQVNNAVPPAATKGVVFVEAGEWKVQGRGGSFPNKIYCGN